MRHLWLTLLIGSTLALKVGAPAMAQSLSEPEVVPGYYGLPHRVYEPGVGYVRPRRVAEPDSAYASPAYAAPAYALRSAPAPVAVVPRPQRFGGGLLDAMLGDAEPAPVGRAPMVAYNGGPAGYNAGVAGYAVQPAKAIDPMFLRQEVSYPGSESIGTIVVDTANKFLYFVEGAGRATRYGIGVGRPGFLWRGEKTVTRKAEWPDWTPPSEMLERRPDLPRHMEGGIANPLGARAMYLGSSLYRIHGTNEPETIGTNVSSGCIRLTNEDVSDLYSRVRVGTRVVVM